MTANCYFFSTAKTEKAADPINWLVDVANQAHVGRRLERLFGKSAAMRMPGFEVLSPMWPILPQGSAACQCSLLWTIDTLGCLRLQAA